MVVFEGKEKDSKRPKSQSISLDDVVDEILLEILHRLPTLGSVNKCKTVSRRWFSLISSPCFISRFVTRRRLLLLHASSDADSAHALIIGYIRFIKIRHSEQLTCHLISARDPHHGQQLSSVFSFPSGLPRKILASCHDLALVSDMAHTEYHRYPYAVCNLFTKQWVALPSPPPPPCPRPGVLRQFLSVTFGFVAEPYIIRDDVSNTFALNTNLRFRAVIFDELNSTLLRVLVFSSETWEWSQHEASVPRCLYFQSNVVPYRSKLHWLDSGLNVVAYDPFNPGNPSFLPVDNNAFTGQLPGRSACLGVSQGSLHLVMEQSAHFSVWDLEDYDARKWGFRRRLHIPTMLANFGENIQELAMSRILEFLAFSPTDANVLYLRRNDLLLACDLELGQLNAVGNILCDKTILSHCREVFPVLLPHWPSPLHSYLP